MAIEMRGASINHLDLFMAHGAQRVTPPQVIAADGAGVIHASSHPSWRPGAEVVVYPVLCDWECQWCRSGQNVRCARFGVVGEHSDGTACELFHVDARNVFRKPKGLSWEEAAAFPLTFLTAWRMLSTRARLQPGEKDVVFEHVGPATLGESMRSVVLGGRVVLCGSTSGVRAEITMPRLFWGQMDLLGSTMGNVGEFQAVLDAIDEGLRPVVDEVYPLSEVQAALARLDAAEQFGKVVLSVS